MTCCNTKAIMKTSSLGLQFFAHARNRDCNFKPESIEHLMLKKYVYETLKDLGYKTYIEENISINGILRRPDVMLSLNGKKIVFEIQVTEQSLSKIEERSIEYIKNGITVIWLITFNLDGLQDFNINNKYQVYVYKINTIDKQYSVYDNLFNNRFKLKDFLQDKLKKTFDSFQDTNLENINDEILLFKDNESYSFKDFVIVNNVCLIPPVEYLIRNEKNKYINLKIKIIYGFSNKYINIKYLIEKRELLKDDILEESVIEECKNNNEYIDYELNNEGINALNINLYKNINIRKVIDILEIYNLSYEINKIILDKYQIDIFCKVYSKKISFLLSFYSDPDILKTVKYCLNEGIFVVVLEYEPRYKYDNVIAVDCKKVEEFKEKIENIIIENDFCPF